MAQSDFDFLFGRWSVINRRRKEWLAGCEGWEEFTLDYEAQPLLGGAANLDRIWGERNGASFEGVSVRTYDKTLDAWTIYWMDSVGVRLTEQVRGHFRDGVGEFFGEEPFKGRDRKLRFLWRSDGAEGPLWEQAYYDDDRGDWETNWEMLFSRAR